MSEILRFETNVPVEIALAYPTGKLVEGQYGDQYYYTLTDGRGTYVQPIVEKRRTELGIGKGEPFSICKREIKDGNRKRIEWQVARVDPAPESELAAQLEQSIEEAKARKAPQPVVRPAAAGETTHPKVNGVHVNGSAKPENGTTAAGAGVTLLKLSLRAAVDAALDAEGYAKDRNYSIRFTSEDLRAMALSLYIQGAREGGGRWAQ